jgi:hypothetical protein
VGAVLVILCDLYHGIKSRACPIFMITFPYKIRNVNTSYSVFTEFEKRKPVETIKHMRMIEHEKLTVSDTAVMSCGIDNSMCLRYCLASFMFFFIYNILCFK